VRWVLFDMNGTLLDPVEEAIERTARMPPYPDAAPALRRLADGGLRAAALSGGA
jgi:hypothetical protein